MALYRIETNVTDGMIEGLYSDYLLDQDLYNEEENEEKLKWIKEIEGFKEGASVHSLEDYWELLEKISDLTDGNYQILNQGRYIEFFSGWD